MGDAVKITITFEVDDDDRLGLAEAFPGGKLEPDRDTLPLGHHQMRSWIILTVYGELEQYRGSYRGVPESMEARYGPL